VQRVVQQPSFLTLSWRPAPMVFRELVFYESLAHSEGSEMATI
jgi:hypothetical protein